MQDLSLSLSLPSQHCQQTARNACVLLSKQAVSWGQLQAGEHGGLCSHLLNIYKGG